MTALIVHPHFHSRRSGVTRHVESVVPRLDQQTETKAMGPALAPFVPRIGWRALLRRVRKETVVWHAHRNHELVVGMLLRAVGKDVRLVMTGHAAPPRGVFTRLLAHSADRRVALTAEGGPGRVVGHGVDLMQFTPPEDRAAAWELLGQGGRFGVGVVGRVRPKKGQGVFAEAVRPLLGRYPDWRGVLIGLVKPKDVAWARGLEVPLVGEQPDVLRWYHGLSVVVQASSNEGFSLIIPEGMACGCVVVSARLPHAPALIEHGRTGFLFDDAAGLRATLEALFRDPGLVERVGRAAAEEARARFGIDNEVRGLMDLYRPLLGP